MHILLITGEYPPMQGGVGDFTREMARAFVALGSASGQGHQVSVLTHDSCAGAHREPDEQQPWHVYPTIHKWRWGCWPQIMSLTRDIRPDVVNLQYQAAIYDMRVPAINLLPWRWHRTRKRPPIVVTYHDLKPPYLFPKAGPLRLWAMRALARYSDATIVTNAEDLSIAQEWPDCPNLHQIPIGSNIAVSPPSGYTRADWRAQCGYHAEDTVWAYFGFLNESKGGETLIRALALSQPPAHLLMIGGRLGSSDPTNQAYADRVESLIAELELTQRVRWTGYLPTEQVSAALLSADVVVLPYRDGISFRRGSLHAALAHGCPVISTAPRVPLPELEAGENVLLVPPDDPQAVSQAAHRLHSDPGLGRRIGQGAALLAAQFTWKRIVERTTHEVFSPLLAAHQAPGGGPDRL